METRGKIIVILGPTSSGKSELGVKLAKKFNGEIVSADSRQIYRKLNIGTGKITKKEMRDIPHHLLDMASPSSVFTVVQYKKLADKAIKDILKCGKLPIITGGTGFYIQSIVDNIAIPEVPPNKKLRKQLERKTVEELFKILKKMDPRRASNIDSKNPRRLIRAIEIAKELGQVPHLDAARLSKYNILQIGIKLSMSEIEKKIEKRVKSMFKKGLLKETEKLHNPPAGGGLSWKRIYELGFEYKYPAMFLQGKISKQTMIERMLVENRQYAKRQMTWFKRNKRIKWITKQSESESLIKKFL